MVELERKNLLRSVILDIEACANTIRLIGGLLTLTRSQEQKGEVAMKIKVKNEKTSAMVKAAGVDPCTHTTCLNIN